MTWYISPDIVIVVGVAQRAVSPCLSIHPPSQSELTVLILIILRPQLPYRSRPVFDDVSSPSEIRLESPLVSASYSKRLQIIPICPPKVSLATGRDFREEDHGARKHSASVSNCVMGDLPRTRKGFDPCSTFDVPGKRADFASFHHCFALACRLSTTMHAAAVNHDRDHNDDRSRNERNYPHDFISLGFNLYKAFIEPTKQYLPGLFHLGPPLRYLFQQSSITYDLGTVIIVIILILYSSDR
jgi:hypothetical protein